MSTNPKRPNADTDARPAPASGLRLLICGAGVGAAITSFLWICVRLPRSPAGQAVQALLGGGTMLIAASVIEWLVHRYVYHRHVVPGLGRIHTIHEKGHHHTIFPTWRYTTNGTPNRHPILSGSASELHSTPLTNLAIKTAHFLWYLALGALFVWLPSWLYTAKPAVLFAQIAVTLVIADLFVRVHDAIHYPDTNRFLRSQRWFQFLANHHYIHHVDTSANVNFLLPLGDLLFGTLRRRLTEREIDRHGTMQEASSVAIGWSEPAIQVATPRSRRGSIVPDPIKVTGS